MLVLAELFFVHEFFNQLLFHVFALVELNYQLFPIYFLVVQRLESCHCLGLSLKRDQGVHVLDKHIAHVTKCPKNLLEIFLSEFLGIILLVKRIFLVLLFLKRY